MSKSDPNDFNSSSTIEVTYGLFECYRVALKAKFGQKSLYVVLNSYDFIITSVKPTSHYVSLYNMSAGISYNFYPIVDRFKQFDSFDDVANYIAVHQLMNQ